MDLDECELEEAETDKGSQQYEAAKRRLERDLPEHHRWLVNATGEEPEFKSLVGQYFAIRRSARKKGVNPDHTTSQEAAGWRNAILEKERAAARPAAPSFVPLN
jgi:hypothetical protein